MPEEATANASLPSLRAVASRALYWDDCHGPPGPSMKAKAGRLPLIY